MIKLSNILLSIFLLSNFALQAKNNWHVYEVEDFYFYYEGEKIKEVEHLEPILKSELFKLQNQLNYHLNGKVDIFLINNPFAEEELCEEWHVETANKAGTVEREDDQIILDISKEPRNLIFDFREQAASIIIYEMMYGESLQDQVRSSNTLYLPNWVMQGLTLYLREGWSTEVDNSWRMIYEQYGLQNFNLIPREYDALKGASFMKFINDNYGKTAIPTVLYMARLTRKFSSALFYSFQKPNKELYKDWLQFYSNAYVYDQRKRLPVKGILMSQRSTVDIQVSADNTIYYLHESSLGVKLISKRENGDEKTLYQLKANERALSAFKGSIQLWKNSLLLFVSSPKGLKVHQFTNSKLKKTFQLDIQTAQKIYMYNQQLYILESGIFKSKLYKLQLGNKATLESDFQGFVNDVCTSDNGYVYFKQDYQGNGDLILNESGFEKSLLSLNYTIKQLIAEDSFLFFNSNKNGVYNGVRYNLASNSISYLTDYRSDIAFHQFSDSILAEYVLQLDQSALFISEHIDPSNFYVYDTISPVYFADYSPEVETEIVSDEYIQELDSLPPYTFQSPVPPSKDFRTSNYDSLKQIEELKKQHVARIGVPVEYFSPKEFYFQFYNELSSVNDLAFSSDIAQYLPNKLGLRIGGGLSNQFNTKNLSLNVLGFKILQSHDIAFRYSNRNGKLPYSLKYMHRQRLSIINELDINKSRSNLFNFSMNILSTSLVNLGYTLGFRHDAEIHLSTSPETLAQKNDLKSQASLSLLFRFKNLNYYGSRKWKFLFNAEIKPYYMLQFESFNAALSSNLNISKQISSQFEFETFASTAMSFGPNPTYFVLGGTSSDLLANYENRNFSSFKEASYYNLVYGVRGFNTNYRNGTSYAFINSQLSYQPFKQILRKPLMSELFNNFRFVVFGDIATSMYSTSIYDKANALNTTTFDSPGGSFTIEVKNIKNPLIASVGGGIHTSLYSYYVRTDLAYGIESSKLRNPMLHVSLGRFLK